MKWKNEIPNKYEFMKVNSFNFIANEKFNSELEHEKNIGRIVYKTKENESQKVDKTALTSIVDEQHLKKKKEDSLESYTYKDRMEKTICIEKTDSQLSCHKRYTVKCFLELVPLPCWYSELLVINLSSKGMKQNEQVYFKTFLRPVHWSENMSTEVNIAPKCIRSEITIPVDDLGIHYIDLQASNDKSTDL